MSWSNETKTWGVQIAEIMEALRLWFIVLGAYSWLVPAQLAVETARSFFLFFCFALCFYFSLVFVCLVLFISLHLSMQSSMLKHSKTFFNFTNGLLRSVVREKNHSAVISEMQV